MAHEEVCVGVNGFGRIGRLFVRSALQENWLNICAINDPLLDAEAMAYLLKYDSIHGRFDGCVEVQSRDQLCVNGKCIKIFSQHDASQIPWGDLKVQIVIESSGHYTSSKQSQAHLQAGAKVVILSAPTKDEETPHIVLGVNARTFDPNSMNIISSASCTTYCVAPLAKLIHEKYGIEEAFINTIHAVTASQHVVDGAAGRGHDYRKGRSALMNIIPTHTGATEAVEKVLPELKDKIKGLAFRVPVVNTSVLDLTCKLKKPLENFEELCQCIKQIESDQNCPLNGVITTTCDPVVSSDFNHCSHSCILDLHSSLILNPTFVKFVAFYDNEWAYAKRLVDLVCHVNCKCCENKQGKGK